MAFMFWIFLLLPAMVLYYVVAHVVAPFIGPIMPVIKWLTQPAVFYAACKNLIVLNVLIFAALLIIKRRWKRAGKLAWPYIDSFRGWKHLWLIAVKLILYLGPLWELFVILFLALLVAMKVAGPIP